MFGNGFAETNDVIVELPVSTYALMVLHGSAYLEHTSMFHCENRSFERFP